MVGGSGGIFLTISREVSSFTLYIYIGIYLCLMRTRQSIYLTGRRGFAYWTEKK